MASRHRAGSELYVRTQIGACTILLLAGGFSPDGVAGDVTFRGYVKSLVLTTDAVEIDAALPALEVERSRQSQNALRLMVDWFASDSVAFELHYELDPLFYSDAQAAAIDTASHAAPGRGYRISDPPRELGESGDDEDLLQNLDRLNVRIALAHGDLTIGRQALSLGAARMINPTDIFLPFDVRTLNTEYRIGIDAVRYQRQLGTLSEVDIGVVLGENGRSDTSAAYIQGLTNVAGHDLSMIYARFAQQDLVGAGIQSAIGEAGVWAEAGYVAGRGDYLRVSAGVDYSFSEKVFGQVEYHYNGAGSDTPRLYPALALDPAYTVGGVFLAARNYLAPSISWTLSPLFGFSIQAILNLDDHSAFSSIAGQYSVSEDCYLNMGYYHFSGRPPRYDPLALRIDLRSEYGGSPDTAYVSVRYYF